MSTNLCFYLVSSFLYGYSETILRLSLGFDMISTKYNFEVQYNFWSVTNIQKTAHNIKMSVDFLKNCQNMLCRPLIIIDWGILSKSCCYGDNLNKICR